MASATPLLLHNSCRRKLENKHEATQIGTWTYAHALSSNSSIQTTVHSTEKFTKHKYSHKRKVNTQRKSYPRCCHSRSLGTCKLSLKCRTLTATVMLAQTYMLHKHEQLPLQKVHEHMAYMLTCAPHTTFFFSYYQKKKKFIVRGPVFRTRIA